MWCPNFKDAGPEFHWGEHKANMLGLLGSVAGSRSRGLDVLNEGELRSFDTT